MPERVEALRRLVEVIDRLRSEDGCPWDRKQTVETMAPQVLEEAFEVADAVARLRSDAVAEELGDLLMNIFLCARIAEQSGEFSLADVARGITAKLIRRHPHVFGDATADDAGDVLRRWEEIKRDERKGAEDASLMAGVPRALPALLRAYRVGEKAARAGFEWPSITGAIEKVREEYDELVEAVESGAARARAHEIGDVLFAVVNVARHLRIDPEMALRRTADRFEGRFRYVEAKLGDAMPRSSLEEMERLWSEAKEQE